ncbi:MAG: FecR family protein, partial [Anaerolineae bacterium]|nr:FecR family protein [Thermoflexales bacterium]MDW8408972.1 FecR family protein [Anaerolineae bacterium]
MNRTDELDNRIEQALREIGSEHRLSAAQRSRIRAAMIATARSRAQLRAQATSRNKLFTLRLLPAGFALASLLLFVFAAYVLMGGAPRHLVAWAESESAYIVGQRHSGPFGLAWHVYITAQPNTRTPIADGDIIYAPQLVVVTFSDESVSTIRPNTEVAILNSPSGIELRSGQIDLSVHPTKLPELRVDAEAGTPPRFRVATRRADIAVRGTKFSVHSDDETDMVRTTEGLVHAVQRTPSGATYKAEISAGEEVYLRDDAVAPPVVQLHAPLARAIEPNGRIILDGAGTRESLIHLIGSAYPNGTLTAIGGVDGLMITTTVDAQGRFSVPITL